MTTAYTIGYEGTDISRFVETLKLVKIRMLADVRAVPISRKKGFSKNRLRETLYNAGIEYCHLVDLGDPKPGRDAAREGKFALFRKIYNKHLETGAAKDALQVLADTIENSATCLMCFERDPSTCHRTIIVEQLKDRGILPFHLFGDSPSKYIRNERFLPGRNNYQGSTARQ